jgi:phosphoglycolate phosphatase-like HAD superfamily hydrolase
MTQKDQAFNWRRFDAYLFDIDGTLLNSRDGVHYNSFHKALREVYGCNGLIDNVHVHGNTDIGILRAALVYYGRTSDDFEAHLPRAMDIMCSDVEQNAGSIHPQLCPSIHELLSYLSSQDKLLGIVTGNLERIGWRKLERAGLRQFFDFGSFSDRNERRVDIFRNGLERARQIRGPKTSVCFVGDTPNDIDAAAQLGLPVIAVATGIYSREELLHHQPPFCVSCATELLESH